MNSSSGMLSRQPFIRLPGEWKCALIRPGIASRPRPSISRATGPRQCVGGTGADSGNARTHDHHIGHRPFVRGIVERQHMGAADQQGGIGHQIRSRNSEPHSGAAARLSAPHSCSACQTPSAVES